MGRVSESLDLDCGLQTEAPAVRRRTQRIRSLRSRGASAPTRDGTALGAALCRSVLTVLTGPAAVTASQHSFAERTHGKSHESLHVLAARHQLYPSSANRKHICNQSSKRLSAQNSSMFGRGQPTRQMADVCRRQEALRCLCSSQRAWCSVPGHREQGVPIVLAKSVCKLRISR